MDVVYELFKCRLKPLLHMELDYWRVLLGSSALIMGIHEFVCRRDSLSDIWIVVGSFIIFFLRVESLHGFIMWFST